MHCTTHPLYFTHLSFVFVWSAFVLIICCVWCCRLTVHSQLDVFWQDVKFYSLLCIITGAFGAVRNLCKFRTHHLTNSTVHGHRHLKN